MQTVLHTIQKKYLTLEIFSMVAKVIYISRAEARRSAKTPTMATTRPMKLIKCESLVQNAYLNHLITVYCRDIVEGSRNGS